MHLLRTIQPLVFACVFLAHPALRAQNVTVLVLDAKNGKPQEGARIQYSCTSVGAPFSYAKTNGEGIAEFKYPCDSKDVLLVSVYPRSPKEQCGGPVPLNMESIYTGVITEPDAAGGIGCPTKVSKKLKAVPGQVVIFVKKPSWYQSHIAG